MACSRVTVIKALSLLSNNSKRFRAALTASDDDSSRAARSLQSSVRFNSQISATGIIKPYCRQVGVAAKSTECLERTLPAPRRFGRDPRCRRRLHPGRLEINLRPQVAPIGEQFYLLVSCWTMFDCGTQCGRASTDLSTRSLSRAYTCPRRG